MARHRCMNNEANRDAWVAQALASLPAGSRLLDAGAGEQPYRRYCDHLRYVSQDLGNYEPSATSVGLQMGQWEYGHLAHECDIAAIPEPDASFDAVLCTEVFEHLADPLAALAEFARLLRPGGELIVTAPFMSLTHFAPHHYATGFNRYYYEKHLPETGFAIQEITTNGNYFDVVAQELRRVKWAAGQYVGRKPGLFHRAAIGVVLHVLGRLAQQGEASDELACFGLHVRATRV